MDAKKVDICIYCAGYFGIETYLTLKEYGIRIDFFGDRSKEKQGYFVDGIYCKSYEDILREARSLIIIVANKNPGKMVEDFKKHGFINVWNKEEGIHNLTAGKKLYLNNDIADKTLLENIKTDLYRGLYLNEKVVTAEAAYVVEEYRKRKKE